MYLEVCPSTKSVERQDKTSRLSMSSKTHEDLFKRVRFALLGCGSKDIRRRCNYLPPINNDFLATERG